MLDTVLTFADLSTAVAETVADVLALLPAVPATELVVVAGLADVVAFEVGLAVLEVEAVDARFTLEVVVFDVGFAEVETLGDVLVFTTVVVEVGLLDVVLPEDTLLEEALPATGLLEDVVDVRLTEEVGFEDEELETD